MRPVAEARAGQEGERAQTPLSKAWGRWGAVTESEQQGSRSFSRKDGPWQPRLKCWVLLGKTKQSLKIRRNKEKSLPSLLIIPFPELSKQVLVFLLT